MKRFLSHKPKTLQIWVDTDGELVREPIRTFELKWWDNRPRESCFAGGWYEFCHDKKLCCGDRVTFMLDGDNGNCTSATILITRKRKRGGREGGPSQ